MVVRNIVNFFARCYEIVISSIAYLNTMVKAGISDSTACLVGKTAIVTGGNAGIGYATSTLLASRGCRIIIACRSNAEEAKNKLIEATGNPNITVQKLDLASLTSVREFAENIQKSETKIDILINNAGVGMLTEKKSVDGLNKSMQTNYFGAFLLTHLLTNQLKASANPRVVFVTSGFQYYHNLTMDNLNILDYNLNPWWASVIYSNSKVCCSLAAQEFGKRLKQHNILVNAADTGASRTNIYDKPNESFLLSLFNNTMLFLSARDVMNAAQTSFHLATSGKIQTSGDVYFRCEKIRKPVVLTDQPLCDKIWKKSEELVKLRNEEKLVFSI